MADAAAWRNPSWRLRAIVLVLLFVGLGWLQFGWCTRDIEAYSENAANRFRTYGLPETAWVRYDTRTFAGSRAFFGPVVATSQSYTYEWFGIVVDALVLVLVAAFGFGLFEWFLQRVLNRTQIRTTAESELLTMPLGPPAKPPLEEEFNSVEPGWDEAKH